MLAGFGFFLSHKRAYQSTNIDSKQLKLYWFIPDGLRAEPRIFNIYQWAREGKLPNLKKLMDNGSYGYSIPVFPGHSATNFATLLTGTMPSTHQVVDGPMRLPGYPLELVTRQGFSSTAREVPAIWSNLENKGLRTMLISVPGSTPPELSNGITIRGRWGSWGIDIPSVIFHTDDDIQLKNILGKSAHVFQYGPALTEFTKYQLLPTAWKTKLPESFSPPYEIFLNAYQANLYAFVYDSTNDQKENYDSILIAKNKENVIANLKVGEWSNWIETNIKWEEKNDYAMFTPKKTEIERELSENDFSTQIKFKVIKLGDKGFFRIRMLFNNLNQTLIDPSVYFETIKSDLPPMIDFVDNFPPQLVYFEEDKNTFIEEKDESMNWHINAVSKLKNKFKPDIIIHDTYNPNQMLTSKWWLSSIDPDSDEYNSIDPKIKEERFQEVLKLYQQIDQLLGEIIKVADENTYIVFSSDHGILPLNTEVRLNNLFAEKGWLSHYYDQKNGVNRIDWKKTKVVYLSMDNIFINPKGLDGNFKRASGEDYEKLKQEVIKTLSELKDYKGQTPLRKVIDRNNLAELDIISNRTGDLVIANKPGFHWSEEISVDHKFFVKSYMAGYKQAVIPSESNGMLTPFVIVGPNVKKDYAIQNPIKHINQLPTILNLLNVEFSNDLRKNILHEILIQ